MYEELEALERLTLEGTDYMCERWFLDLYKPREEWDRYEEHRRRMEEHIDAVCVAIRTDAMYCSRRTWRGWRVRGHCRVCWGSLVCRGREEDQP